MASSKTYLKWVLSLALIALVLIFPLRASAQVDAGAICMLEKDLIGSYSSDITMQDEAAALVFGRALNVRDLITHRFPLEEYEQAFDAVTSGRSGKVILLP